MTPGTITEADVRTAHLAKRAIQLTGDTIVTPAARDLAAQLGVALVERARTLRSLALGADHGGFPIKESIKDYVRELGWDANDLGCHNTSSVDYPHYALAVARSVARGEARFGIMVDGAGIGSAMVCNKVAGVRAALCYDLTTAANAREHNNANVLTLGGTLIGDRLAKEIVREFLSTDFAGGRHQRRVDMIDELDSGT